MVPEVLELLTTTESPLNNKITVLLKGTENVYDCLERILMVDNDLLVQSLHSCRDR